MTNMQHLRCITLIPSLHPIAVQSTFMPVYVYFLEPPVLHYLLCITKGFIPPAHLANAQMNIFLTGGFP